MGAKECAGNGHVWLCEKALMWQEGGEAFEMQTRCRGPPASGLTAHPVLHPLTPRLAICAGGLRGECHIDAVRGWGGGTAGRREPWYRRFPVQALPASAPSPSSLLPCSPCFGCARPKRTQRCRQAALLGQRHRVGIDGRRPCPRRARPAGLRAATLVAAVENLCPAVTAAQAGRQAFY